jgi:hypothetical protein
VKLTDPESRWLLGWNVQGDLAGWTLYENHLGQVIAFPKAPPKSPPTKWQRIQRSRYVAAAAAWKLLSKETRTNWELATHRLSLGLCGYHLYVHYHVKNDYRAIQTIERQSGLKLLPRQ